MKKIAPKFDLSSVRENFPRDSIGDELMLFEDISKVPFFDYPNKLDVAVATLCLRGEIEGSINLKQYKFSANDFSIMIPGQIVQYSSVSEDFRGLHIVMSLRFLENLELNIKDAMSVSLSLQDYDVMHLDEEQMEHLIDYYNMLRKAIKRVQNPHRIEIARALTTAMFYGINDLEQLREKSVAPKSNKEVLFDSFYELILQYYNKSREVGFYADRLHLTPKYLSAVIKEVTGKSAFEWINNYVILEAKSMLKSTGMTVQQISVELNFANQSFFGKYFKQHTGVSPSEYRIKPL